MDCILQIKPVDQVGYIGSVGVHFVAVVGLVRTPMSTAVVSDHAEPFAPKKNIIWLSQSSALNGQP
jgi:hypothetical protein